MMRIGTLLGLLLFNWYTYGLSPAQVRQLSNQATQAIAQNNFDSARNIIQQLKDASQGATARQLETSLIQAQSTQAAQQAKSTITQGQTEVDKLNAELKEKSFENGQNINKLRKAEQQVYEATAQLEQSKKTVATLQQQIQDQQTALSQALDKKGQDALATQIAILKKQYEQEKADFANRARIAEERKQEAINESNKNEHELALIKKQLEDSTKDKEGLRTEYQQGIDQLKKEFAQELEKIKTGNLSDFQQKLDDKTRMYESCSKDLDRVQKEQVQMTIKLDTTGAELRNSRQDLDKAVYEKKQIQAGQDAAIKAATKNLQAEKEKALQEFKDTKAELEQKHLALTKEKEQLRTEYQKDLEQRQKEYTKNLEDIKKGDISTLQKQLEDKTKQHDICSTELTRVQHENTILTQTEKALRDKLGDIERAEKNLQTQLEKAKTDKETALKEITNKLQNENASTLQKLNATNVQLEQKQLALTNAEKEINKYKNQEEVFKRQKGLFDTAILVQDAVDTLYKTLPSNRDYDLFEYVIKAIETGARGSLDKIWEKAKELKREADSKKSQSQPQAPGKPSLLPTQPVQIIPGQIPLPSFGKTK